MNHASLSSEFRALGGPGVAVSRPPGPPFSAPGRAELTRLPG